mmetsp:Transcript_14600/g.19209  ORF Transcript_14600/g.19209 Transcript_14600/m.19209 type:complete len:254 (-) Transcript_14600:336-1097(-)|eukprot:CAMPEP_0117792930 /NCGR_PEP_ID=MMETSP0948-20121206/9736_1 /TAXON_ID=44440 /ORGANISM="Chattonella subsalsa, Strain CCMP2191" /LENGTH=253 /DNA_ID=CAMNT_0005623249 /DNA_START=1 /DNA_END=762 /DNA_ORIENTATION=+
MLSTSKEVEPFAVWELTDEAILIGIKDLEDNTGTLRVRNGDEGFENIQQQLDDLRRCHQIHREQEIKQLFPILNKKFKQVVAQSSVSESMQIVQTAETSVQTSIDEAKNGLDKAKMKLLKASISNLNAEMKKYVAMKGQLIKPLLPQLGDTDWKRGSWMQKVLSVRSTDFVDFQLKYVTSTLSRRRKYAVLKRYMEGLKMSSSSDQYLEYKMVISQAIGPATWQLLVKDGLDGEGEQPPPPLSLQPCEGCMIS